MPDVQILDGRAGVKSSPFLIMEGVSGNPAENDRMRGRWLNDQGPPLGQSIAPGERN